MGAQSKRTTSPKKTSSKKPAKKTTAKKTSSKKTTTARRRTRTRRPTWRATQQQPSPERLTEIQRALAEKGYFDGDADGKWDEHSINALKRFQEANNLKPDGKLSALSLIALGLGPKHPLAGEVARPPGETVPSSEQGSEQPAEPKD
jgi:peptidoglycan hydrolase-like protein with peptidoglycan-binding domain